MILDGYIAQANEWIAHARERNASHEHPDSLRQAHAADIILKLCAEITRLESGEPVADTPVPDVEPKKRRAK